MLRLFALFIICSSWISKTILPIGSDSLQMNAIEIDHTSWDTLLKRHVDEDGNVDYQGFKSDLKALEGYLSYLAENIPAENSAKAKKLAYYINLYNAATVKLILDNYPLASIKDIKSPWARKWIPLDGREVSLGHIEHKILRKMNEPRIHFAINCASYSCPKLLNEAFTSSQIEMQLKKATQDFITDKRRNTLLPEKIQLSQIFKWFKKDFTEEGSLIDYLNTNTDLKLNKGITIEYLKYDWSLNEVK